MTQNQIFNIRNNRRKETALSDIYINRQHQTTADTHIYFEIVYVKMTENMFALKKENVSNSKKVVMYDKLSK